MCPLAGAWKLCSRPRCVTMATTVSVTLRAIATGLGVSLRGPDRRLHKSAVLGRAHVAAPPPGARHRLAVADDDSAVLRSGVGVVPMRRRRSWALRIRTSRAVVDAGDADDRSRRRRASPTSGTSVVRIPESVGGHSRARLRAVGAPRRDGADNAELDALGLVLDSDPRRMSQAGQLQSAASALRRWRRHAVIDSASAPRDL
jgi:hypothetical protein